MVQLLFALPKIGCFHFLHFIKFIKINASSDAKVALDYMTSKQGFDLSPPKLILSIIGSGLKFTINEDIKIPFKRGLIKAAKTTNAWIIAGGTNMGLMKLIGDAVAEDLDAHSLTVLGVATWGCIANREELLKCSKSERHFARYNPTKKTDNKFIVPLNPNYSHFVFVDDGSVGKMGRAVEFRNCLESLIKSVYNMPMVLIIVS